MSIFQCDQCGCLENSALSGTYHIRNAKDLMPKELLGKKLCCVCGPEYYPGGTKNPKTGKWHERFKRLFFPKNTLYTDGQGNVREILSDLPPDRSKGSEEEIK